MINKIKQYIRYYTISILGVKVKGSHSNKVQYRDNIYSLYPLIKSVTRQL